MTASALLAAPDGTPTGLWGPTYPPSRRRLVVLLGRAAVDWWDTAPSAQPRLLAERDAFAVVVDTPGYGSGDDVDLVDAAVAWAATQGVDIDRVTVVAAGRAAPAGINWALANDRMVDAVLLLSPVLDLVERLERLADGNAALSLPGAAGSFSSTPDHASLDITGDLDVRVDAALVDWTPPADQILASKWTTTGDQRSWTFGIATNGRPYLTLAPGGTNPQLGHPATAAPAVAAGDRLAVRVTVDVNNGAGGRTVTFYTAPTIAGPWTQLGAPVVATGTVAIHGGTAPLLIGAQQVGAVGNLAAAVYGAEIRSGIGGTAVAAPDWSTRTDAVAFTDTAGRNWAYNGTATLTFPGSADAQALVDAYGGVDEFAGNITGYDPGRESRRYGIAELLGDRLTVLWNPDDTDTPADVTAGVVADYRCATGTLPAPDDPLSTPTAVFDTALRTADRWSQQAAHEEMARWETWLRSGSGINTRMVAADGFVPVDLGDRVIWTIADWLRGTIAADGTIDGGVLGGRNAMLVDLGGQDITQHPAGGGSFITPPPGDGDFYWPQGIILDNDKLVIGCVLGTGITTSGRHFRTLDPDTLAIDPDIYDIGTPGGIEWGYRFEPDGDTVWITGTKNQMTDDGQWWTYLARCPAGHVLDFDTWDYWTGYTWSTDALDAGPVRDGNGFPLDGWGAISRTPEGRWLCYPKRLLVDSMTVYVAPEPTGPWWPHKTFTGMDTGTERYGGTVFSYAAQALPESLNPADQTLLMYHSNQVDASSADVWTFRPHVVAITNP